MKFFILLFSIFLGISWGVEGAENQLFLRDNLGKTQVGDYLVTQQNKNYTLLIISEKQNDLITIEEITVPSKLYKYRSWKEWIANGAPGNTCWLNYTLHIPSGEMVRAYHRTRQQDIDLSSAHHFLTQLLNLRLTYLPLTERKKIGPPQQRARRNWNPKLIYEGKVIPNIPFDAYRTRWPKDNTEMSERLIVVYLPVDNASYPSYFPYWLHIPGAIGKAKVRIVDSGRNLVIDTRN